MLHALVAGEIAIRQGHVLAPLDSGQDANTGGYFLVMPRADGSLADEIAKRGTIPDKESLDILIQIALGLQEIGQLVHRDLKPANILLHQGSWKIELASRMQHGSSPMKRKLDA